MSQPSPVSSYSFQDCNHHNIFHLLPPFGRMTPFSLPPSVMPRNKCMGKLQLEAIYLTKVPPLFSESWKTPPSSQKIWWQKWKPSPVLQRSTHVMDLVDCKIQPHAKGRLELLICKRWIWLYQGCITSSSCLGANCLVKPHWPMHLLMQSSSFLTRWLPIFFPHTE